MGAIPTKINQVTINGVDYALDVSNYAKDQDSFHRRIATSQYPEETSREKFWRDWTLRSWHEGERLKRVLGPDDLKAFRYHDAEGVETSLLADWGEAKLTPALSRSLTVSSSSLPMTVTSDGTTLVVGLASSPYIKLWTVGAGWTNATAVAGSGTVTDLITDGTTMYAVRGGAVLTSTDSGANWTAVGSYTTAVGVAAVNGELFVGKSDGIYNHTQDESVSSLGCTVIAGYRENIYFAKDCRLYRYDARGTYLYDQLPTGFNVTALVPYRQILLIIGYYKVRSGYRAAVYYIVSGSENHLYSLGTLQTSSDYRIYAAWGGDDEIFFANPDRGGVDRYSMEAGGLTCGPIWNAPGKIPFKSVATCEGYLFIGRYDNVGATDGVYVADICAPTAYNTTGYITTAEYDFDYPNDTKIFRSVRIEHRRLLFGESIDVDYSLDGGTTWYDVGLSNIIDSTGATWTLNNVSGNSIKLKFTFTGPGTSTPTLLKCVVHGAPKLDNRWIWVLRILIMSQKWGGAIKDLITAKDSTGIIPYVDDDGQEYKVVIDSLEVARVPDPKKYMAIARVILRQV